jgi:hypothetical protein
MKVLTFGLLTCCFLAAPAARADFIYATAGNGSGLVKVDTTTGAGTAVGATGTTNSFAAAFAPNGTLYGNENYGLGTNQLVTYNLTTGAATPAAPSPFGVPTLIALQFNQAGTLFGASSGGGFYQVNLTTGAASPIGNGTGITGLTDLALDTGGKIWATNKTTLYTINPTNGTATQVAQFTGPGSGDLAGIAFAANGTLYATSYVAGSSLYTVNTTTGAVTSVGSTGQSFILGADLPLPPVPEPAGLVLAGIGAACFAGLRLRKSRP